MESMKYMVGLLLLTFLKIISCQTVVTYNELEELEAACPQYDSCRNRPSDIRLDTIPYYSCQCGKSCAKFGTCCVDSPHINFNSPPYQENNIVGICDKIFESNISTHVVSQCVSSWRGSPLIKSQCERSSESLRDPIGLAPATSLKTGITYKNYFCAACNNDKDSVELWNIAVSPEGSPQDKEITEQEKDNLLKQMVYDASSNEWKVPVKEKDGTTAETVLQINYYLPSRLAGVVRPCVKDMISECHSNWIPDSIQRKCGSYMAIVYIKEDPDSTDYFMYRNIHCAICNYESYFGNICKPHKVTPLGGKTPLSFTHLLDIRLADGNKVGEVNPCKKGEIYDSFFRKCRTLGCALPGYVLKGDKCARA